MVLSGPYSDTHSYTFEVRANPLAWGFTSADRGLSEPPAPSTPDLDIVFGGANTGRAWMARFNSAVIGSVNFSGTIFSDMVEESDRRRRKGEDTRTRDQIFIVLSNGQERDLAQMTGDIQQNIADQLSAARAEAERINNIIAEVDAEILRLREELAALRDADILASREDIASVYRDQGLGHLADMLTARNADGSYVIDADEFRIIANHAAIVQNDNTIELIDFSDRENRTHMLAGQPTGILGIISDLPAVTSVITIDADEQIEHQGTLFDASVLTQRAAASLYRADRITDALELTDAEIARLSATNLEELGEEAKGIIAEIEALEARREGLIIQQQNAQENVQDLIRLQRAFGDEERVAAFSQTLAAATQESTEGGASVRGEEINALMRSLGIPSLSEIPADGQERTDILNLLGLDEDASNEDIQNAVQRFEVTLIRQLQEQGIDALSDNYSRDDALREATRGITVIRPLSGEFVNADGEEGATTDLATTEQAGIFGNPLTGATGITLGSKMPNPLDNQGI